MTYITDNTLNMTYDEYTYQVDMMLMSESGEPSTFEQLNHISTAYEQCLSTDEAYASIADFSCNGDYDDWLGRYDDILAAA